MKQPTDDSSPVLGTEQTRAVTELHWHRQFINGMGTLVTPFARLRSDFYVSENVPTAASTQETTARVVPTAGLDVRMPFVADHGFAQSVLTPVAQIIATTDEQDDDDRSNEDAITLNFDHTNLFLSDRFTGYDRYEGGTRANAGVVYTCWQPTAASCAQASARASTSPGENSFVEGSGLNGTSSDLVGGLAYQPNDYLRFTYQARVEEDLSRINVQEAMLGLTFDRISGSLAMPTLPRPQAYGRADREKQVWGDAVYRLTGAWSVFGGFRYDLEEDTFMEKPIGIGFDCDCMNARLTYSEDKDLDDGVDTDAETVGRTADHRTDGRRL